MPRLVVESGSDLATLAEDAKALAKTVLSLFDMSPNDLEKMGEMDALFIESILIMIAW